MAVRMCHDCTHHEVPPLLVVIITLGKVRPLCGHELAADDMGPTECVEMRRHGAPCGPVGWLYHDAAGAQ